MQVNTNELNGAALDWAVAKCEGDEPLKDGGIGLSYSTDWLSGGPIIEREGVSVEWTGHGGDQQWMAYIRHDEEFFGATPLTAAMRCYVASRLGDTVEITDPKTLAALEKTTTA